MIEPMNRTQFMRKLITQHGPSMQAFGAKVGVTKQAVRVWCEKGVVPGGPRCWDVSQLTGVPVWDLNPNHYRKPK